MTGALRTVRASWRPLSRSVPPRTVATEIATLAAASLLAAFLVLFGLRVPYDNASFLLGMDYDRSSVTTIDGLHLTIAEDALYATGPSDDPTGGSALGDGEGARPVSIGIYAPDDSAAAGRLLRTAPLQAGEAIVDEATLHGLGVAEGEPIILIQPGGDLSECVLTVASTVPPYHPEDDLGAGGLVIMSDGACAADIADPTSDASRSMVHCFDCAPTAADQTRWEGAVRASVGFNDSPFATIALALIGVVLWVLAARRAHRRLRAMVFDAWLTLAALGTSPRATRALVQTGWIVGAAAGSIVGSIGASLLMTRVAQLYVQPDMTVVVAAVLVLIAYLTRLRSAPQVRPEGSDHHE